MDESEGSELEISVSRALIPLILGTGSQISKNGDSLRQSKLNDFFQGRKEKNWLNVVLCQEIG